MHKAEALDREVAQLGRVLGLGPRCRRFESCLPDSVLKSLMVSLGFFGISLGEWQEKRAFALSNFIYFAVQHNGYTKF